MINTMKLPVNVTEAIIEGSLSLDAVSNFITSIPHPQNMGLALMKSLSTRECAK